MTAPGVMASLPPDRLALAVRAEGSPRVRTAINLLLLQRHHPGMRETLALQDLLVRRDEARRELGAAERALADAQRAVDIAMKGRPSLTLHDRVMAVVREEAARGGITAAELTGECRQKRFTVPRAAVGWRLVKELGLSIAEAGRRMKRDPATIRHFIKAHERRLGGALR